MIHPEYLDQLTVAIFQLTIAEFQTCEIQKIQNALWFWSSIAKYETQLLTFNKRQLGLTKKMLPAILEVSFQGLAMLPDEIEAEDSDGTESASDIFYEALSLFFPHAAEETIIATITWIASFSEQTDWKVQYAVLCAAELVCKKQYQSISQFIQSALPSFFASIQNPRWRVRKAFLSFLETVLTLHPYFFVDIDSFNTLFTALSNSFPFGGKTFRVACSIVKHLSQILLEKTIIPGIEVFFETLLNLVWQQWTSIDPQDTLNEVAWSSAITTFLWSSPAFFSIRSSSHFECLS